MTTAPAPTAPVSRTRETRAAFTALLVVEALKLRRSSVWVVALILPVLAAPASWKKII